MAYVCSMLVRLVYTFLALQTAAGHRAEPPALPRVLYFRRRLGQLPDSRGLG